MTDEGDDQQEVPPGWTDVVEVRSIESARFEEPAWNELQAAVMLNWATHEGVCPQCTTFERTRGPRISSEYMDAVETIADALDELDGNRNPVE